MTRVLSLRVLLGVTILFLAMAENRPAEAAVAGDANLVGWWRLDDGSGTTAQDSSDYGNHGTLQGAPGWVDGHIGGALDFGGSGDYVEIGYSSELSLNDFTVSAWVNLAVEPGTFGILGTRVGGDTTFDFKVMGDNIHGDIGNGSAWLDTGIDILSTDTGTNGQGGDLAVDTWYMITYVIDNANQQVRLYLDADLKRTIDIAGTPLLMKAGQSMRIGHTGTGAEWMNGILDEVAIWDAALTPDQVRSVYESGVGSAKAYGPTPADGEWFRYSTDPNGLAWTLPGPRWGGEVTCDVLWFGTNPGGTPELLVTGAAVESVLLAGRAVAPAHYWWRVDCYDPNGSFMTKTEGDLWTFSSARDFPMVFLDESGPAGNESTDVNEQDRIANRDDYLLSLSMDPVVPVSITISEVPNNDRLTDTRETVESWDGVNASAPRLVVSPTGYTTSSRINSSADDLEQYVDDGVSQGVTSSDLEFFDDTGTGRQQIIGLRFNDIAILPGATIESAVVEFVLDETNATGEVHGFITGEAVVDAAPLANTTFELRDRLAANPTTTSVSFIWTLDYVVGETIVTSDIASIIQEIVNRSGWGVGQSIVLFLTEDMNPDEPDIDFIDADDPWALRSSTYVLDSSNWEAGVIVTIAAIDDDEAETNPELVTLTSTTSSTDTDWTGLTVADMIVNIDDNECGAWSFAAYDLNTDCYVDIGDLAMILDEYLMCTLPNVSGCTEDYRP